ncbi:MerR family transcriptional regulator [Rhizobium sp. BR 314]|uniref:MerR family transcriptional regulator n=1 Tax=Rhizobium sp. BR 314 TaxID=3040013 RepID=UPI0039BEE2EC
MNIGELAKRTGLTASRIRFYESAGLLKVVERRPNGYRSYPPEAALMLELITTAQRAGFSLDEIRLLLPPDLKQWNHEALLEALQRKITDIEALEVKLAQTKTQLVALIGDIKAKPGDIDCATNAQRVLSGVLGREVEVPIAITHGTKRFGKTSQRPSTKER